MKKTTRLLLLLLSAVMTLTAFTACFKKTENGGDSTDPTDVGTTPDATVETNQYGEEILESVVPDELDYEGAEIHFLIPNVESYYLEWDPDTKEPTTLESKILLRNTEIERELGVDLIFHKESNSAYPDKIVEDALSAFPTYDIISGNLREGGRASLLAYYRDLNGGDLTYLNLDRPYWNQSVNETVRTNDRQYVIMGDINLSMWDRTHVVFFNRTDLPSYANMTEDAFYEMVSDGGWTYQSFYEMVKDVKVDDEDGTFGNNSDYIGLTSIVHMEASDGFFFAWDLNLTQKDEITEAHTIVTGNERQRVIDAFGKLTQLYMSEGAILHSEGTTGGGVNTQLFTSGHALFMIDVIAHNASDLSIKRDMEDGFGIVPLPKYDSLQQEYYTGVNDYANAINVMDNGRDGGMISAVLELMAHKSYNDVRPYYVKSVLKARTLSKGASDMFDIIMAGVRFDFISFFQAGGTDNFIGNLWTYPFQTVVGGGTANPRFEREDALNAILENIDEILYDTN